MARSCASPCSPQPTTVIVFAMRYARDASAGQRRNRRACEYWSSAIESMIASGRPSSPSSRSSAPLMVGRSAARRVAGRLTFAFTATKVRSIRVRRPPSWRATLPLGSVEAAATRGRDSCQPHVRTSSVRWRRILSRNVSSRPTSRAPRTMVSTFIEPLPRSAGAIDMTRTSSWSSNTQSSPQTALRRRRA